MSVEVTVAGPHGTTRLVRDDRSGRYRIEGQDPDRTAIIMLAIGVLGDLTDDEREQHGLEDVWL